MAVFRKVKDDCVHGQGFVWNGLTGTWSVVMPPPVTLLISRHADLIQNATAALGQDSSIQLRVLATVEDARLEGWHEVTSVILHLPRDGHADEIVPFAQAMSSRRMPFLILADRYQNQQAVDLSRAGVTDYAPLPLALKKLALFARARGSLCFDVCEEVMGLVDHVGRAASQDATVLLSGETGTGKTCLARLMHNISKRRAEPFIVVDCGSLSENLIESEIFGHCKGAFTDAHHDRVGKLATAGRGTLLL